MWPRVAQIQLGWPHTARGRRVGGPWSIAILDRGPVLYVPVFI